jgi:dipeptidyl aminopeptidase/acylaminoacyl peptidase
MKKCISTILIIALLIPSAAFSQQKFDLTVDNIMRGPGLIGYEPGAVRWSQDSQRVYFRWKQSSEPRTKELDTYTVNRDGSGLKKLTEDEARNQTPVGGDLTKDKKLTVYVEDGDVFVFDHIKQERRQITATTDVETNAVWGHDQKSVIFNRAGNLFKLSLEGGSINQLTDFRTGGGDALAQATQAGGGGGRGGFGGQVSARQTGGAGATGTQRATESQEYLKKEEKELIEAIKERAAVRAEQEERRKKRERRKPFNIPQGQSVVQLSISPDEKYVIASISQSATGTKSSIVPNYVTESGYTEDIPARAKVGDAQNRTRFGLFDVATGDVKWVDHGQRLSDAAAVAESGEGRRGGERGPEPRERDVRLSSPLWSDDGKHAVVQARAADNKDRWIMLIDPVTAKTRMLDHLHDDAWINGPGAQTLGWLPDSKRVYFQSERDGYSHLYTASAEGTEVKQLTQGQFEVSDVRLSRDKTRFYFTSSEGSPFERHLYSMPVEGGARTRITSMSGNNDCVVSPDETMLAIVRSASNKPPELYLAENKAGAEARKVTTSPTEEFFKYAWIDPPIVKFKARDGAMVPARIFKPANYRRGGPAVLFVHGAGYLQNVHKWWSSYSREYMFHHLLMERGFLVFDVDYRGSAGYGRDWRTAIYRHMGGKDLTDYVDAAKYLVAEHGVDAARIGLYGGSYGGFITLMALFTQPDTFRAGAALRPVTDWAHYNHGYTSNILNMPQLDSEAYKQSSPIYYANGLKGALLICHGMVDVNVHFQDTVRLVQRLIELKKENWELAVYPVEDHGFVQPSSWADEYKRILKLFTENLR